MKRALLAGLASTLVLAAPGATDSSSSRPSTPLTAVREGQPVRMLYELKASAWLFIIPITGKARFNVELQPDTYRITSAVKTTGLADVLVDYDLGGQSGLDVIRSLRDPKASPDPDLPVLLLGPLELPFLFEGAREAGASAILPKPLNANTLGQSLMTVLAARCVRPEILTASGLH